MSKKNRAKSKAKRFGEGSAKPIVSAATYGVGGNAFAQAIADPVSTVHSNKPELLVVDGYNVIHCRRATKSSCTTIPTIRIPVTSTIWRALRSSTTWRRLPRAATRP